jgi:hypothetical protein
MNIVEMFEKWRGGKSAVEQPSREVRGTIQDAPKEEDPLDFYLDATAFIESSNNPLAQAKTSSAAGLYQFTTGTWQEYNKKMGTNYTLEDRFNPEIARKVARFKAEESTGYLTELLGRQPTNTERYMVHFMGRTGSRNFLQASPTTKVDKVVSPAALKANRSVFYNKDGTPKRVIDVYKLFDDKFEAQRK